MKKIQFKIALITLLLGVSGLLKAQEVDVAQLQRKAVSNDPVAQFTLATYYEAGHGVARNAKAARYWYFKSAEAGYEKAEYRLSQLYQFGKLGLSKNIDSSRYWQKKAGYDGNLDAQKELYHHFDKVQPEREAALYWMRRCAENGDSVYMYLLAKAYADKEFGDKESETESYNWYLKSAEAGYRLAQTEMGNIYLMGIGRKKDFGQAMDWFKKAAEQNEHAALYNIGTMYEKGEGVEKNHRRAFSYYRKASENGDVVAKFYIGVNYVLGDVVRRNLKQAAKYFNEYYGEGDDEFLKSEALRYWKRYKLDDFLSKNEERYIDLKKEKRADKPRKNSLF
ncbi:tetratricopeptide repeat protein [Prolixibacter denitrificans]|uniref:TPR repeat protein n=1 Tax=Prolixibacter denitrificans TaxID=1541063 RepID=A0A2P8CAS4_9BACT|nr:tetratricopeptide repeat protein [Prolixibacter denitrificans]PSK82069.1 hypothetical protein CLV93_107183 [Prolixibacter denitrificans]GET22661.1 hypothetical protein JCM18694_29070 [Prolixibacter denitrificans]